MTMKMIPTSGDDFTVDGDFGAILIRSPQTSSPFAGPSIFMQQEIIMFRLHHYYREMVSLFAGTCTVLF